MSNRAGTRYRLKMGCCGKPRLAGPGPRGRKRFTMTRIHRKADESKTGGFPACRPRKARHPHKSERQPESGSYTAAAPALRWWWSRGGRPLLVPGNLRPTQSRGGKAGKVTTPIELTPPSADSAGFQCWARSEGCRTYLRGGRFIDIGDES